MTRSHLHRLKTTPQGKGREKGNVGMQLEQTANIMCIALVIIILNPRRLLKASNIFVNKEFMREQWHTSC